MQYWVDESHQHVVLYKAQTYYTIPLWQPEPKLSPGQYAGSQMLRESFQFSRRFSPRVTRVLQMAALYNEDPSKECLFARLSLDLNLLALQRSSTVVEVRH